MGAFILCSCLIDAIAGFRKGCDTDRYDYKGFIYKNMTSYDKEKMYSDLRCKLVHSYSEGGSYLGDFPVIVETLMVSSVNLHCFVS